MLPANAVIRWSAEAETHLSRVPGFVRRMVRRRAEDHVREAGRDMVTADDLATLKQRRFGDAGPPAMPMRPPAGGN
jgi:AdoMet-dependent heme synthase